VKSDFESFKSYFQSMYAAEFIESAKETIHKELKELADESGKVSTNKMVLALSSAVFKINMEYTLKALEAYHDWQKSSE
jgi:hypothetical protein